MKNILLWSMLFVSIQAIDEDKYPYYKFEDNKGFSPIHKELPLRFPDQDICEIIWDEELRDCTGFPEGSPSPDSDGEDSNNLVSYKETK
jgi:hypothetical protein